MTAEAKLAEGVADCLDRRREALTETLRVVASSRSTVLLDQACRMAVPMIYAIWEGYAKETLQLYVEYLGSINICQAEVSTSLLAYAWTGSFARLRDNMSHVKKVELVDKFFAGLTDKLTFDKKQREINTKSNLMFDVLKDIADSLCLDISHLMEHKRKLDALVHRRNTIAHGGRDAAISEDDVVEYRDLVLTLMTALERTLLSAIDGRSYKRVAATAQVGGDQLATA